LNHKYVKWDHDLLNSLAEAIGYHPNSLQKLILKVSKELDLELPKRGEKI